MLFQATYSEFSKLVPLSDEITSDKATRILIGKFSLGYYNLFAVCMRCGSLILSNKLLVSLFITC